MPSCGRSQAVRRARLTLLIGCECRNPKAAVTEIAADVAPKVLVFATEPCVALVSYGAFTVNVEKLAKNNGTYRTRGSSTNRERQTSNQRRFALRHPVRCTARECNRRTILWEIVAWATVARVARRRREQTGYVRCDGGIHLLSHDFCIYPQGCTRSVRSGTLSACGYTVCARQCVYIYMCVCMCVLRCFETYILRSQWSKRRTKSRRRCATAVARDAAHAASSALSNRDIIRRSAGHTKELPSSDPIKHM